jgi:site-specific recombinase XerD
MGARIDPLARSFERHLRAENKAERTVRTYLEALGQFAAHLQAAGRGGLLAARTEDIEAFLGDLLGRCKPGTAANRYRSLRVFYRWLEDEGEIVASPMAKLKSPTVPEQPVPVLADAALRRLLDVCAGRDFEARRDTALIRVLLDAGPRRAEVAAMRVEDVDFDYSVVWVRGKGGRDRALPFGRKTDQALDRYLRARARHRHATAAALWLGPQGSDHRLRRRAAGSSPRPPSRYRGAASTPVPPHLRPPVARRWRRRYRPDAACWLALRGDAAPLRCLRRRRPCPGGASPPLSR